MPRLKTVTMDGATYTIAPLTWDQVEARFSKLAETQMSGKLSIFDLISTCLNNASPDTQWTPDRVGKEMDMGLTEFLFDECLAFSKLKVVSTGESAAAQV